MKTITPFLWFDDRAEDAANFYVSTFGSLGGSAGDTRVVDVTRYGEAGSQASGRPVGSVMTVAFRLAGQDIVALNGLATRVKVIGKSSTDLMPGRDLPERAEVLITETFTSGLMGEGIFPTLEHAHQHLLTPDAAVIPAVGSVMGYLAGGDTLKGMLFADRIEDFDLTPFNDFAPPVLASSLDGVPHEALSDDLELLRFDFREKSFPMAKRPMRVTATKPGLCVGVAQWIRIELDRETSYDNRPAPNAEHNDHWTHLLHRFPKLLRLQAGDVVAMDVCHNRSQVNIDLVE